MIYFDNNATTAVAPEVLAAMLPFLTDFYGNPSSAHTFGRESKRAVETARESMAALIGARAPDEIAFTSGGTESDNWAIGAALEIDRGKKHIVTTRVEHEAVRKVCCQLEKNGYEVTWLEVDESGALDLDELKAALRPDTALVSVMLANNETGVLFPVEEIGRIVKENSDAHFHVDGVNAVGKIPIDLKKTEIDLFSVSGHKFHAPKGIGALYVRESVKLPAFFTGGEQENARRAGTEAVHQIAGLGAACELAGDFSALDKIQTLRDKLENFILQDVSNAKLNGARDTARRLPNTTSISFQNTNGELILAKLNDLGVCVSTGSACSAANHQASAVLQAMNIPFTDAMGAIRFSLGRYNTEAEVDFVIEKLPTVILEIRQLGFGN